jgi:hypothetical protein
MTQVIPGRSPPPDAARAKVGRTSVYLIGKAA